MILITKTSDQTRQRGHALSTCMYVCMYVWSSHIAEYGSTGKVANPACGRLNRENEHSPVPVRC